MKDKALGKKVARAKVVVALTEKLGREWKKLGEEYDALAVELHGTPGLEAQGLRVTDSFAGKNTAWGHGRVRRFEMELLEEKPAAPAKK